MTPELLASRPTTPGLVDTPVVAGPPRPDGDGWESTASLTVSPDEPVLAGHFPGFPVLPGVCVVGAVLAAARDSRPPGIGPVRLAAIESAKFRDAVRPADDLTIALRWTTGGAPTVAGRVHTARGLAATVRLRLRAEADR